MYLPSVHAEQNVVAGFALAGADSFVADIPLSLPDTERPVFAAAAGAAAAAAPVNDTVPWPPRAPAMTLEDGGATQFDPLEFAA